MADGSCEEIGADPCASAGGSYQGLGTACEPVWVGDIDCDGSLLSEWGYRWPDCLAGPEQPIVYPACDQVDLDLDGDVDLGDVALFGLVQGYQACSDIPLPCCGNGVVEAGEQCDDGNFKTGDGCDAACRLECIPGAVGCGWADGDMITYNQESWGGDPGSSTAAALLVAQFNSCFPTGVVVGYTSGFLMAFTSAAAILNYQPQSGAAAPLNSDLLDPSSSASGVYGGFVLALQLDVDFADSGQISGTSGLVFGDLRLCGLTTTPAYNGMTVRQLLDAMNTALGAGPAAYSYGDMAVLTNEVSSAFEGGAVSLFAQQHLFNGACPCTPGAPGCGWEDGDMITYDQDNWGSTGTNAALLLGSYFDFIYPGGVQIGLSGDGFSAVFTSANAVLAYQPASGPSGVFDNDLVDPVSTSAGIFGGYALAVQLDVDFGDAHHLDGAAMVLFGDLRVCGLTATPGLNGSTVRQVLGAINQGLGGGTTPYSIDDLSQLAFDLSRSFESGAVSVFAQEHLFNGPCPCTPGAPGCGWEVGDVITYRQDEWGAFSTSAGTLLADNYNAVYASTFGIVEIGLTGAAGFSMQFTSANAIFVYQPSSGLPAPLNVDLVDPISTASGVFGGEVLALRLNIDFSDAGLTAGTTGLSFGDLTLCSPEGGPSGISVRAFMDVLNSALGGGSTPYSIDDLNLLTQDINAAFRSGPSLFAQDHLFNGPCP